MSSVIDSKVVEMKFDNSDFESNVKTSMNTLSSLKESLNFDGVSDAVEAVSVKFSVLNTAIQAVVENITDSVYSTVSSFVSSLSVDQITAGWEKYAQKTAGVQTIMAATGLSIDEVNEQLEKLNWFTDETSYNFTDMITNIGKFTSNGIELETAVTAMEGISTWASLSGQGVTQASRAMYNLAQAISVGAVKLMDWRSIENANMATTEFKQTAIDTAVALGELTKVEEGVYETTSGTEVTVNTFNSTLSDCWFTADVLIETLNRYGEFADVLNEACDETGLSATQLLQAMKDYDGSAESLSEYMDDCYVSTEELAKVINNLGNETYALGEKSFRTAQEAKTFAETIDAVKDAVSTGWMTTFENIFGNYKEAKEFWTDLANELYDVFAEGGNARNELLAAWKELGGRDDLIEAFWNVFHAITDIIDTIKDAWYEVFPEKTAEQLVSFTSKLKELTEKFKMGDETAEKLKNTFKGLFAIVSIGKQLLSAVYKILSPLWSTIGEGKNGILSMASSAGEVIVKFNEALETSEAFAEVVERLQAVVSVFADFLNGIVGNAIESFNKAGGGMKGVITVLCDTFGNLIQTAAEAVEALTGFSSIRNGLHKIGVDTTKAISSFVDDIVTKLGNGDFQGVVDFLNKFLTGGLISSLIVLIGKLMGAFSNVNNILYSLSSAINAWQQNQKTKTLLTIAASVSMLTVSLKILETIDEKSLRTGIGAITVLIAELVGAMEVLEPV